MEPTNDDEAIAQFHADARRRRQRIMAITAVICGLIGAAILVVAFAGHDETAGVARYEVRTIAFGIAFVIAGVISGVMAYKGD